MGGVGASGREGTRWKWVRGGCTHWCARVQAGGNHARLPSAEHRRLRTAGPSPGAFTSASTSSPAAEMAATPRLLRAMARLCGAAGGLEAISQGMQAGSTSRSEFQPLPPSHSHAMQPSHRGMRTLQYCSIPPAHLSLSSSKPSGMGSGPGCPRLSNTATSQPCAKDRKAAASRPAGPAPTTTTGAAARLRASVRRERR